MIDFSVLQWHMNNKIEIYALKKHFKSSKQINNEGN